MHIYDYTEYTTEGDEELNEDFFMPLSAQIQTGFFADVKENCKYCKIRMETPVNEIDDGGGGYDYVNQVYACPNCGWWYEHELESTYLGEGDSYAKTTNWFGILRKYDVGAIDLPVSSLRHELKKRSYLLYHVHPKKFEELGGSVFRDYMECEVRHVGGSGDGGIDLILIDGKQQWIVQVKRRSTPQLSEGVRVIRELVGTMTLESVGRGIFVTTASHFTAPAKKTVKKATELGAVERIDLIDFPKFRDMLQLLHNKIFAP